MEANRIVGSEVRVIEAKPRKIEKKVKPKKRVAAYCRVSKDIEEQETSFATQKAAFEEIINSHPGWELAGIYADKGITGTSSESREEFLRMIDDAKAGLIDMILVKSISRFARNTVDTLKYTRSLKDIDVSILFEKEKINTSAATSEMLLTVYASFAQEESRSISENQKRGFINRFALGIPKWSNVFGYRQKKNREWVIEPTEAAIVRWIFETYEHGTTPDKIAEILRSDDSTERNWGHASIRYILSNVSYCGDLEMQKYSTRDFISHHMSLNTGERYQKKYYAHDHHPAIIDRESFQICQKIISLKNTKNGMSQYPFGEFLKCPYCGEPMVCINYATGPSKIIWTCGGHGTAGYLKERSSCPEYWIWGTDISKAFLKAVDRLPDAEEYADMKDRVSETGQIEYYYLARLANKITFPDWGTMRVEWRSGIISEVPMDYEKTANYPVHDLIRKDKKYFLNGEPLEKGKYIRMSFDCIRSALDEIYITPITRDEAFCGYGVRRRKEKST